MNSIRALGLALVIFSLAATSVAAPETHQSTSSSKIIYDMTTPWPFRHVKAGDTDGDGILDNKDMCPGTPAGATVDANGCPVDSDGDGVPDGVDRCENTTRGAMVDRHGCPMDSDKDGVPDGIDRCEKTPHGATVDATGCPSDSDGDGVADGIDQCPGTNVEWAVDKKGCPIPVNEVAQQFLDEKAVALNIQFESGKADLLAVSEADLQRVGEALSDWPEAKVEVGGHTDAQGSAKFNETLSKNRAESVKTWLTSHYPKINPDNLSTKGYGESEPIASNDTAEGMAQNRRVTFTLMNAKELGKSVETRRYKKRSE
ncbi:MAG TPA: OmpA family protein [Candidatus Krumholzibacteria bacterium]|nr:OmpA family protein [Candidatus Krumholzibacteria bacterium]